MIHLELALQIAIAVMGSLSAILLGMGERQVLLPAVAIMVAIASVYFNDVKRWVRLGKNGENLACLVAVGVAVWDLFRLGRDSQLLAAANLLVYLQFVLQFEEKSTRRYWMLALLSLMQVSVAAALGLDLSFGLLLFSYLLVALATLSLFFAYRELGQYSASLPMKAPPARVATTLPRRGSGKLRSNWLVGDTHLAPGGVILSSAIGESEPVSWRYARLVFGMTALTVFVAFSLFFVIPRMEQTPWRRPGVAGVAVVGIPETVSLSEVGTIYESPATVMRVHFLDQQNRVYDLREPPLLRGFHLTTYGDNRWRQTLEAQTMSMPIEEVYYTPGLIWQVLEVEPSESDVLFHVHPARNPRANGLLWDYSRDRILRPPGFFTQPAKYRLATETLQNGRQSRFTRSTQYLQGQIEARPYLEVSRSLTRLPGLAQQAVAGVDPDNKLAQIDALNTYLTDPQQFAYTLQPPPRDNSMDAIEDFLINNRQGHCEYFASAMALMLRSLQIPSRMVIGYKGDEYNALGNFYQVRQLHAHAWVEAYLAFEELPPALRAHPDKWSNGAWYTIDPSPVALADEAQAVTTMQFLSLRQTADYMRFLWSSYVMGMDAQRQQQSIYSLPVVLAKNIADRDFWARMGKQLRGFFRGDDDSSTAGGWHALRLVATAAVLLLAFYVAFRLLRRVQFTRWWQRGDRAQPVIAPPRAETLLFRRLESLLARLDFHRPDGQTPREFATAAGGLLARSPATRSVADLPSGVVDSFYRLRFAGRGLDRPELETLEHSLAQLESALTATENQEGAARG